MKHFSVQEVAPLFGRSPRTIRDWIETGCKTPNGCVRLKAMKIGRWWSVPEEELVLFRHRLSHHASVARPSMEADMTAVTRTL
jgi:hypothetical protein